jgi:hypothetical protein
MLFLFSIACIFFSILYISSLIRKLIGVKIILLNSKNKKNIINFVISKNILKSESL